VPPVVHRTWQSKFLAPAPIYLDATVTVGVLSSQDRLHARASAFWADHIVAQREMLISLLTLDETIFQLLRNLIAAAYGKNPNQIKVAMLLKQQPGLLAAHSQNLQLAVQYILAWTKLVDGSPATVDRILDTWLDRFQDINGVRDAWHLSLAEHSGAQSLATGDSDFQRVKSSPTPLQIIKL
jgi:predicted nucleic acid-binding protein